MSRLINFTEGVQEATAAVYLHDKSYEKHPVGWYEPATRIFPLRHTFKAPPPIKPMQPFPATRNDRKF